MCLQGLMKFHQWLFRILRTLSIQNPLRIKKGNNSNSISPWPLPFSSSIRHVHMNVFAKFDEISSMIIHYIKETKRYGHIDGRSFGRSDGRTT